MMNKKNLKKWHGAMDSFANAIQFNDPVDLNGKYVFTITVTDETGYELYYHSLNKGKVYSNYDIAKFNIHDKLPRMLEDWAFKRGAKLEYTWTLWFHENKDRCMPVESGTNVKSENK